jgi:cell division protein FtsN
MSGARQRERRGPGTGRFIVLGAVAVIALGSTFAAGIYIGRHGSRPVPGADAEPPRKPAGPRRSGLVEPVAERKPDTREPLTFYQTLTAPLAPLPASPRVSTAGKPAAGEPASPRPGSEIRPSPTPSQIGPSMGAAAYEWTVQVGVFRDRRQAEGLKRQLAAGGVDAHLVDARGEDGQVRHKVRVGSFKTRDEAARVAARVASERRVPTYVTLR